MSFNISPTQQWQLNLASFQGQKCLCGSCGIQHHTPRDPERVLPIHALNNRQSLVPAANCEVAYERAPPLLAIYSLEAPWERGLRQSLMFKRTFVEIQDPVKFQGTSEAKRFEIGCIWGRKEEWSDFDCISPPKRQHKSNRDWRSECM